MISNKHQYSTPIPGPWHDTWQQNDEYRRESIDGGTTWEAGIKFIAKDGQPGNDANVPRYIKSSYIDGTIIKSPTIETNLLTITVPSESSGIRGLLINGYLDGARFDMARVGNYADALRSPYARFYSPAYAHGLWNFSGSQFLEYCDSSEATVVGTTFTLA